MLLFAGVASAQPVFGPRVSLRTGVQPTILARFDDDTLYLRAWDDRGSPITTLDSADLLITLGRDTAEVVRFEKSAMLSSTELALSFVLDNSSSMFHSYDSLTRYLDSFLDSLGPGAKLGAITFDNAERQTTYDGTNRERLFLAWLPFTPEDSALRAFWHFYDTIRSDRTPLFDAMWKSLEHIGDRRRSGDSTQTDVMLIVSDGSDNCSSTTTEDLSKLALAMGVHVFLVNFRSEPDWRILWLVTRSHGQAFTAETLPELHEVLNKLRISLSTGYRVVFEVRPQGPSVLH